MHASVGAHVVLALIDGARVRFHIATRSALAPAVSGACSGTCALAARVALVGTLGVFRLVIVACIIARRGCIASRRSLAPVVIGACTVAGAFAALVATVGSHSVFTLINRAICLGHSGSDNARSGNCKFHLDAIFKIIIIR